MHSVAVNLEAAQYLAGWRPQRGTLFLPALSDSRVGDHVAARVGIHERTIRATVFGRVALVRRVGRPALPPGVEIVLDRASLPAAGFLAAAARGEPVTFQARAPRFAVEHRLAVPTGGSSLEAITLNVSEGGCALRWPGPPPPVGAVVALRLGSGLFAPTGRAVLCWSQPEGPGEQRVGLRVIGGGRAGRAWRALAAEAAACGARVT